MVLCNYFMNGHCRFGSKCMNDHIDLKTILKTEVEAAINGKQWLLSCFGPFKESIVLPNFIPDRSFEEVRLDFMEASKNGAAQQHVSELISQYNDAMNKLNQLKIATPEMIQLLANIYNQSVQDQSKSGPAPTGSAPTTNVFAVSNAQQQQNPFQMGNIFGGNQQQQQQPSAMNAGSIFGGAATSNPFQSSSQTSIFGAPKEQTPAAPQSTFSFALSQQPQQPAQSIFGATPQSPPTHNIFGASQPLQQPQQPTSSIFGGQTNSFSSAGSIFAPPAQQPQQQPPMFGQSIFAQSQPAPATSIFGQTQQTPMAAAQPPATNIFGQFQQQQQMQIQPAPQPQPNLFAQPVATPPQNVFGIQPAAPPAPSASIFQIQQPSSNPPFGANPFQTQPPPADETAFSKPEDLTPDELQAFQADTFQVGQIPLKPPPRHLCI